MEMRIYGRSGMKISILGFGCGAVGGLMVRGDHADQERAVARALDAGVNYFDTAVQYGNGESEKNLGRVLNKLKPTDAIVGTKVRLPPDAGPIAAVIAKSLEGSLQRLGRERVDILHLHNPITSSGGENTLSARQVLDEVVPAFEALRQQGKLRFLGITAVGETSALHAVIDARVFDSAQVSYNMLNPSAATALPPNYPAQDYGKLFDHTQAAGVGVVFEGFSQYIVANYNHYEILKNIMLFQYAGSGFFNASVVNLQLMFPSWAYAGIASTSFT